MRVWTQRGNTNPQHLITSDQTLHQKNQEKESVWDKQEMVKPKPDSFEEMSEEEILVDLGEWQKGSKMKLVIGLLEVGATLPQTLDSSSGRARQLMDLKCPVGSNPYCIQLHDYHLRSSMPPTW